MEAKDRNSVPDREVYRFGSIAVRRKYVTLEKVQAALAEQMEEDVAGRPHRRLDEILLEHDWITDDQVQSIVEEMGLFKA